MLSGKKSLPLTLGPPPENEENCRKFLLFEVAIIMSIDI